MTRSTLPLTGPRSRDPSGVLSSGPTQDCRNFNCMPDLMQPVTDQQPQAVEAEENLMELRNHLTAKIGDRTLQLEREAKNGYGHGYVAGELSAFKIIRDLIDELRSR
jgi:hypothetical protein